MALLAIPGLAFGRQGLGHTLRRISAGGLRFFVVWGWIVAVLLFLMYLGREGRLEFSHGPALFYALSFLGWFAAGQELARRKRDGELRVPGDDRNQRSRTPERPLSFVETLRAQEAQLRSGAAEVPGVEPAAPLPLVTAPQRPVRAVDSPPALSLEPVRSMFDRSRADSAASPSGMDAPSAPVSPPRARALSEPGGRQESVQQPRAGGKQRRPRTERSTAEARIVEVLKQHAVGESAANASEVATMQTGTAVPEAAPYSPPSFRMAGGPEPSMRPTPATTFVPSQPPASYVPPAGPAPTGPVTLGGGFNYKPSLVESRLGQSGSDAQNGSGSGL
jgi:hypothetical protein